MDDQAVKTVLTTFRNIFQHLMSKAFHLLFFISFFSTLSAQTWKPLGPFGSDQYNLKTSAWGGGTGQVHTFAFAPREDGKYDWYCGSPWGGIWKSTDEGAHWTDLNPQLEQVSGVCSASKIVVDPHNPSTIYVSNGRRDKANLPDGPGVAATGVFKSSDGGKTFQHTGLKYNYEDNNHILSLIANPYTNATQLFAATDHGLYMSQADPDKKWTRVFDNENLFTVVISPHFTSNHTVYAAGEDVYISRKDGGKNSFSAFEPSIGDLLPAAKSPRTINICIADKNGTDVIYALVYQDGKNFFLCYDGSKWELRAVPVIYGIYIPTAGRIHLAVNPTEPDHVYAGVTYVCRTEDGGKKWQMAGSYCQPGTQNDALNIHGDIDAIESIPGTDDVLIGTDGGIFRYVAAEKKEVELNTGLNISQVIGMSAPAQAPYRIMIGKQDTGYDLFDGNVWTNFAGGDGFSIHALPLDTTLYVGNLGQRFRAKTSKPIRENSPGCISSETALYSIVACDPKVPERVFIGGTNISYMDQTAMTFTKIYKYHTATDQPVDVDTQIEAMGVGHDDRTGESVVYASNYGFYNGGVCKMIRGHITVDKNGKACDEKLCPSCWVKVPLPNEKMEWLDNTAYSVSGIAVSDSDPDELWVSFDHSIYDKSDLKVLHSTDGGASWSDMNKGLPAYVIPTAIQYDAKTKYLYLGTATGIYLNKNDGGGWKAYDTGLPKAHVKAMEINQSIRKIRVGLYGRGVWEVDLAD